MIFRKELATLVEDGKKTATRRPVKIYTPPASPWVVSRKTGVRRRRQVPDQVMLDGQLVIACRYRPGHTYAVQPGRGKAATCRILIQAVQAQRVGDLTLPDAKAEGFTTREEFMAYWVRLYDQAWLDAERGRLARTMRAGQVPRFMTAATLARFNSHHADRKVWAISFELDRSDHPRLLAASPSAVLTKVDRSPSDDVRNDADIGYTTTAIAALPDEPEAVRRDLQEEISSKARENHQLRISYQRSRDQDERDELQRKLATLQDLAQQKGINIRDELRGVARHLAAVERKINQHQAAA